MTLRNVLCLIAIVSLGCGSDSNSPPGGGGDAGPGASATPPPCLLSLPCQPSGTCTSQALDPTNPYISNSCYATGIKSCMSADATGAFITTMYNADGSVCYKMSMTMTATGITSTYTDGTGAPFATATSSMTSTVMNITCNADGQTYAFDYAAAGMPQCTAGTCTCP